MSCFGLSLTANGWQLAEGGDFQHTLSYEVQKFISPKNCPTKHETATFGKVLLCPVFLFRFNSKSIFRVLFVRVLLNVS